MTPCDELGFLLVTHFAPIHVYNQMTLRTEAFTQSSFYAQVFLHREVCAQRDFCTRTPLHTDVFTQRRKFLQTDALYQDSFAHINKGHVSAFTHRTFATETLAQNNCYTQIFWGQKKHT